MIKPQRERKGKKKKDKAPKIDESNINNFQDVVLDFTM